MARRPKNCAEKGSTKWLQLAVNQHPELLQARISTHLQPYPESIEWLSPLRLDEYAEYSDREFVDLLELELRDCPLESFWPKRGGPNWDGLAKTGRSQVLLIEAKANVDEMKRPGSLAKDDDSRKTIAHSLSESQAFLSASQTVNWSIYPHYQYANRLAHLYLLAELNGIDAYLLMIYFLNDEHKTSPNNASIWEDAIRKQHSSMGLRQDHKLEERVICLYLDVNQLRI